MKKMMNNYQKEAERLKRKLERWFVCHDGDMMDFFSDGSIYGEDEKGRPIVGFGVIGSANIVIDENCVLCGGWRSTAFSEGLKEALKEVWNLLDNC